MAKETHDFKYNFFFFFGGGGLAYKFHVSLFIYLFIFGLMKMWGFNPRYRMSSYLFIRHKKVKY